MQKVEWSREMHSSNMGLAIPSEVQLLFIAASVGSDSDRSNQMLILLGKKLNWNVILKNADFNGVSSLLYWQLAKTGLEHVPDDAACQLRNRYLKTVGNNMMMVQSLIHVLELFRAVGINVVPYKGLALAQDIYEDIALRQMCDIDIIVREKDVEGAKKILLNNGYMPTVSMDADEVKRLRKYDCEECFFCHKYMIRIELHWRLLPPVAGKASYSEFLWDFVRETTLFGVTVLSVTPEMNALIVFMHAGIKHRWSEIKLIADAARIIIKYPELNWELILKEATRRQVTDCIMQGVYLAHALLDAPMPVAISSQISRYPQVLAFAGLAVGRIFRDGNGQPGFKEWRSYIRAMQKDLSTLETTWSPGEEIFRYARAVLLPELKDKSQFPYLPSYLSHLYYLIRPLRLLKDNKAGLLSRLA
jgi:hypothetical protein